MSDWWMWGVNANHINMSHMFSGILMDFTYIYICLFYIILLYIDDVWMNGLMDRFTDLFSHMF